MNPYSDVKQPERSLSRDSEGLTAVAPKAKKSPMGETTMQNRNLIGEAGDLVNVLETKLSDVLLMEESKVQGEGVSEKQITSEFVNFIDINNSNLHSLIGKLRSINDRLQV